jgi:phosphohistidine phosphatase
VRYLNLIRHAKSSWADKGLDDRDRPLNRRGRRQVEFMAAVFRERHALDGTLYCSPARRAVDTARYLLDHAGLSEGVHRVQYMETLYTFQADDLWHWLARTGSIDTVTVVGHNPALLDLVNRLLPHPLPDLPTCSLVQMRLAIDRWADLEAGCGVLTGHLIPAWVDFRTFWKRRPRKPGALRARNLCRRTQALLRYQSDMIHALEPGVRVGADPEFLHQYRTHLRRTRSVGQALLRLRGSKPLQRQLKALKAEAGKTSDLRDLDVLLMRIRDWEDDEAYRPALQVMHVYDTFRARRDGLQQELAEWLVGEPHLKRLRHWRRFVESRILGEIADAVAPKAVQGAVDERVAEHDRRLASLTVHSPDTDFHELRKELKKLRYLAELVIDPRRKRMQALKARQERFGAFQDLTVQLSLLLAFAERMDITGSGLQALIEDLEQAREGERGAIMRMPPLGRFRVH